MTFELILWYELSEEINSLPEKTRIIIKTALKRLLDDPFPGTHGDKENLKMGSYHLPASHFPELYRFYEIDKDKKLVIVQEILPIEQAHKKYGYY